jgi:hypothetical protein
LEDGDEFEFRPVEKPEVAQLEGGDDQQGEKRQRHERRVQGAAELLGLRREAGVTGGNVFGVAVAHESGHGQGQDILPAVADGTDTAFIGDEQVDGAGQFVVARSDGHDVVAVVGHARGDGAAFESDTADEGDGRGRVRVTVDHGDLEHVLRGVGHGVTVADERFGLARAGDDLAVERLDHADRALPGEHGEIRRLFRQGEELVGAG